MEVAIVDLKKQYETIDAEFSLLHPFRSRKRKIDEYFKIVNAETDKLVEETSPNAKDFVDKIASQEEPKVLCGNSDNKKIRIIEHLEGKKQLRVYSFDANEVTKTDVYIRPSDIKNKVFETREGTGTLSVAGALTGGVGGALTGAVLGAFLSDIFPKEYEFDIYLKFHLQSKKKIPFQYLYWKLAYTEDTANNFRSNVQNYLGQLENVMRFADRYFGETLKPVAIKW